MISCKVNDAALRRRFSAETKKRAFATLMPNVRSDTDPYVPYRTGQLDRSMDASRFEDGIIAWRCRYAGIVYNMARAVNWTRTRHPLAGAQWMERSKAANNERWKAIINAVYSGKA